MRDGSPIEMTALEERRLLATTWAGLFTPAAPLPGIAHAAQRAVATGDFNGDGRPDIAVVAGATGPVVRDGVVVQQFVGALKLMLNDGSGSFSLVDAKTTITCDALPALTAADFNGDGKTDLALTLPSTQFGVLISKGDGSFNSMVTYTTSGTGVNSIVAGDFNNDGRLDIATAGQRVLSVDGQGNPKTTESLISVHFGYGTLGLFTGPTYTHIAGDSPLRLACADFNSDKLADLAVGSRTQLKVLTGKGDGTFDFPLAYPANNVLHVMAPDLNGDGRADLLWTDGSNLLRYALGNGGGLFAKVKNLTNPAGAGGLGVGDFNGDGYRDIVISPNTRGAGFYLGAKGGVFTGVFDDPAAAPGVVADFNGDGRADVVNYSATTISLATPPPVYLNYAGTLTVNGTGRSDSVTVGLSADGSKVLVGVNGTTYQSRVRFVKKISISTNRGNDYVAVDARVFSSCLISGGLDNDTLIGGSGKDTLNGDDGADTLFGADGEDLLSGGNGNDNLKGGRAIDSVFGNAGADVFSATDAAGERKDVGAGDVVK